MPTLTRPREIKFFKSEAMRKAKKPAPRKAKRAHGGARPRAGRKRSPLAPVVTVTEKKTAAEMARPYLTEAIGALVGTIRDRRATASARNAAAKHLLDAAKLGEGAEAQVEQREVSDMDLARWLLSILENAADDEDEEDEAA